MGEDRILVFAGAPIEDATEHAFLERLIATLRTRAERAVILVNFFIGADQRQIDCVVATEKGAAAVEIKGYRRAVVGGVNGAWTLVSSSGRREPMGGANPYDQALSNRFRVSDAMRTFAALPVDNARDAVAGMLCIFPAVPRGSDVPSSSHKLTIGGFDALSDLLNRPARFVVDPERWAACARHLGLNPYQGARGAAAAIVETYLANFLDLARAGAEPFVEPEMQATDDRPSADGAMSEGEHLAIIGPSGAGKSVLMLHLAGRAATTGLVPLSVSARDFQGQLLPLLAQAAASCTTSRLPDLWRAVRAVGSRVLLCVDALNECPPAQMGKLVAAMQAASLRHGVQLLTTSQNEVGLPGGLHGVDLRLKQPSKDRSRALVEAHLGRGMSEDENRLLDLVASAQDARVLAEVLTDQSMLDGRYALYEAFARRRLALTTYAAAATSLGRLATAVRENLTPSLAAAAAHRIIEAATLDPATVAPAVASIAESRLLVFQHGTARFRHDLIADFFASDHLLRSGTSPDVLATAAARPFNAALREFLLGGCGTRAEVEALLDGAAASSLVVPALEGRCGKVARAVALDRARDLLDDLGRHYGSMRLEMSFTGKDGDLPNFLESRAERPIIMSPQMEATFGGLPSAIATSLLDHALRCLRLIDEHLEAECLRLAARYPKPRTLRALVFGGLYGQFLSASDPGLLRLLVQNISLHNAFADPPAVTAEVLVRLERFETLTPGELFILFAMLRHSRDPRPPARLVELVDHVWRMGIYHLRLSAMDLVQFGNRSFDETTRRDLHALLSSWLGDNIWLNTIIIDALKPIGGVDIGLTVADIVAEARELIDLPVTAEIAGRAMSIFTNSYDGPAEDLYSEAFFEILSAAERAALLARAIVDPTHDYFAIDFAIGILAETHTPEAVPSLVGFAEMPMRNSSMPQSAVSIFVAANAALARAAPEFERKAELDAAQDERAWRRVAPIVRAMNKPVPADADELSACWSNFRLAGSAACMDVVESLISSSRYREEVVRLPLLQTFPDQLRELARTVLQPGYAALTILNTFRPASELLRQHRSCAIRILETVGRSSDTALLRPWIDQRDLGEQAHQAASAIERRIAEAPPPERHIGDVDV